MQKHNTLLGEPILSLSRPHTGWHTMLITEHIAVKMPIWGLVAPISFKMRTEDKGPTRAAHTIPMKTNSFKTGGEGVYLRAKFNMLSNQCPS